MCACSRWLERAWHLPPVPSARLFSVNEITRFTHLLRRLQPLDLPPRALCPIGCKNELCIAAKRWAQNSGQSLVHGVRVQHSTRLQLSLVVQHQPARSARFRGVIAAIHVRLMLPDHQYLPSMLRNSSKGSSQGLLTVHVEHVCSAGLCQRIDQLGARHSVLRFMRPLPWCKSTVLSEQ
jgi:hypothetical protein